MGTTPQNGYGGKDRPAPALPRTNGTCRPPKLSLFICGHDRRSHHHDAKLACVRIITHASKELTINRVEQRRKP
jgi:hypothetical protein